MPLNKQTQQVCDSNKPEYATGYDQIRLHLQRLLKGAAPRAAIWHRSLLRPAGDA
jgi:hypothetical protein